MEQKKVIRRKKSKEHRITVRINSDQREALDKKTELLKTTDSAIFKEALDAYLFGEKADIEELLVKIVQIQSQNAELFRVISGLLAGSGLMEALLKQVEPGNLRNEVIDNVTNYLRLAPRMEQIVRSTIDGNKS